MPLEEQGRGQDLNGKKLRHLLIKRSLTLLGFITWYLKGDWSIPTFSSSMQREKIRNEGIWVLRVSAN